jgi:hypothetical protein
MKLKIATACLLAALAQAPHALAAIGTVSYFGIVENTQTFYFGDETVTESAPDYDVADLFGGGNLEGDQIAVTLTYNTNFGLDASTPGATAQLYGGSAYTTDSPLTSVAFAVQQPTTGDIYSYSFTPDYYSTVSTSASAISEVGYSSATDSINVGISPTNAAPIGLTEAFSSDGYGPGNSFLPSGTNTGELDSIVFDTLEVSVSATPEPQTWALMLLGVGAIGLGLRSGNERRRLAGGAAA